MYEYIDYSSNYAGSLIAQTEVKLVSLSGSEWITFDFSNPKPVITNNTRYYLTISAEETGTSIYIHRDNMGDYIYDIYLDKNFTNTLPDPLEGEIHSRYRRSIYCSYTITPENNPPIAENDTVIMNKSEISL